MNYRSLNPYTEELVESFEVHSEADMQSALGRAVHMSRGWRTQSFEYRAGLFRKLADLLEQSIDDFAGVITAEMGKPFAQAQAEVQKCVLGCRYFAEHAESMLTPVTHETEAAESFVRYDPLGPILAIMPWNFPFWQVFRFAAPAMMAGNVVLLKHAPNTPRCALELERVFREAGFPDGCFQSLFLTNDQVGVLLDDARLRGVTLTGSVQAGQAVAARAGQSLKPMVLELGGSDAFIVCEDADLESAIQYGVQSRLINSGQTCISAKRFLVHKGLFENYLTGFIEQMKKSVVGDPSDPATDIGPMARDDLRAALAEQVARAEAAGAEKVLQVEPSQQKGFFYGPTVLTAVTPSNPVWREELFGPVAVIMPYKDDAEAVTLANDSPYGLAATVWTNSSNRAASFPENLDAGCVFVNDLVKSDPRLPFGGTKFSGFGRELAREGMLEFVNAKTVVIR